MRLLHVDTLEFHEFTSAVQAPPYIITSHRWQEGEVSFKQLLRRNEDSELENTPGMIKIRRIAEHIQQWRQDFVQRHERLPQSLIAGLFKDSVLPYFPEPELGVPQYFWIDTCCINKESSAELQEAITSMFQWYQQAWCCLAYLQDVVTHEGHGPLRMLNAFARSAWFTRGWTLQELLAPKTVIFLDRRWNVIGHKSHQQPLKYLTESERLETISTTWLKMPLNNYIALITGIGELILWDYAQTKNTGLAVRMAWLSGRTTTRLEDLAYCMLGICEVYMPLIYGEGANAMKRLRREIREEHGVTISAAQQEWRPTRYAAQLYQAIFGQSPPSNPVDEQPTRAPPVHQRPKAAAPRSRDFNTTNSREKTSRGSSLTQSPRPATPELSDFDFRE